MSGSSVNDNILAVAQHAGQVTLLFFSGNLVEIAIYAAVLRQPEYQKLSPQHIELYDEQHLQCTKEMHAE